MNKEGNKKNEIINKVKEEKTEEKIQDKIIGIKNEEFNRIKNFDDSKNSENNSNEFHLLEGNKENKIINKKLKKNKKIKNESEEKMEVSTCIFCIEEFNEDEITNPLLGCYNQIHGKCLTNYVEPELNNNKFPIKCPLCPKEQSHK